VIVGRSPTIRMELEERLGQLKAQIAQLSLDLSATGLYMETVTISRVLNELKQGVEALGPPGPQWEKVIASTSKSLEEEREKHADLKERMALFAASEAALPFAMRHWSRLLAMPLPWDTSCACCAALCPDGKACSRQSSSSSLGGFVVCDGQTVGVAASATMEAAPVMSAVLPLLAALYCLWKCWAGARMLWHFSRGQASSARRGDDDSSDEDGSDDDAPVPVPVPSAKRQAAKKRR